MRHLVWAALLGVAFAGCISPDEPTDPLLERCPHWAQRGEPVGTAFEVPDGTNVTQEWVPRDRVTGDPRPVEDGRTFDRAMVRVLDMQAEGDAHLRLSAHNATGRALLLYEHGVAERPSSLPSAVIRGADERVFDVFLAPVTHGAAWTPSPVVLLWEAQGGTVQATIEVTLYDRVCGIP